MKNLNFIKLLFISLLFYACKVPYNALNKSSIPQGIKVRDITDTSEAHVYLGFNQKLNIYLFEKEGTEKDDKLAVILIDNEIENITYFKNLENYYYYESSIHVNEEKGIPTFTDLKSNYNLLNYDQNLSNSNEIIFKSRGISYDSIINTYHKSLHFYFVENYEKFSVDTMENYSQIKHSRYFNNNLSEVVNLFEHSINYYNVFPEKTIAWTSQIQSNFIFLYENLKLNYDELLLKEEFYTETNDFIHQNLISVLKFISEPSPDNYRLIQFQFFHYPEYRWIDIK